MVIKNQSNDPKLNYTFVAFKDYMKVKFYVLAKDNYDLIKKANFLNSCK
jgi:hypothetical protein